MSLEDVLGKLAGNGLRKIGAEKWQARCPAHDDRTPSLGVDVGADRRVLVKCHAGCSFEAIVTALALTEEDFFASEKATEPARETLPPDRWPLVATYTYENRAGDVLYRVQRRRSSDSGRKTFRQHRADGRGGWLKSMDGAELVLYRLPQLTESDGLILICEGEKDVDRLSEAGLTATTNVGGAGKWRHEYSLALKGRDVVILPDNDEPGKKHAETVLRAISGIAARVAILELPGLPPKGDVSDWLDAGGTAAKLTSMASAELARHQAFMAAPDRIAGEAAERIAMATQILTFGVRFLDDALGGIATRDLVLVGARSGIGKTSLATIAALANCREGRRVHYFALEAEDKEIERRMKFQIIAREYYRRKMNPRRIRFLDWYLGKLEDELGEFGDMAEAEMRDTTLKNLRTFYRIDSFTSAEFTRQLDAIKDETDLVILDHFQYIDMDADDRDENRAAKRITKQIRDSALRAGKPVIMVAHVRKSDRKYSGAIPELEDFHGSSDIPKMATKAIMLAPNYGGNTGDPSMWSTFLQVGKCRMDNSLTRYVAKLIFNTRTDSYQELYTLGRMIDGGKKFEPIPEDELPDWAARGTSGRLAIV